MIVFSAAQHPLPFNGFWQDGPLIWDADLKIIDRILADDTFIDILWRSARRLAPNAKPTGRKRLALNRTLRAQVLKHIRCWSFPSLTRELQRNLDYRAFTQLFDEKIPTASTFSRNFARADAIAVRELNEHLLQHTRQCGVTQGRIYRQDTTVCETNVHYPTDSSLLQDGSRVLLRLVRSAEELLPALGHLRDRSKAVRNRVLEIARAARGRSATATVRREQSYRCLLRLVRPIVTRSQQVAAKLGDRRLLSKLGWQQSLMAEALAASLRTMGSRVEKVIRQTRARICRGIHDYPDKVLSLFIPSTAVICKGKAHKPNEFGRLIDIVEVENGIVSDYQALQGNPNDGSLLIPALERHKARFGHAPRTVATDRGYWSAKNQHDAQELGVKHVAIPARGKLSKARLAIQRSRWFRRAQRWRAAGEGRIGTLKNVFGMDRCMYQDLGETDDAMLRWVGWCVFANNLVSLARALRQKDKDVEGEATERHGRRKAA